MSYNISINLPVKIGEPCYFSSSVSDWSLGICDDISVNLEDLENIKLTYDVYWDEQGVNVFVNHSEIVSKVAFLEWISRVIDIAKDEHKFKGDIENNFGAATYSNWLPLFADGLEPSIAYMAGMGLIDLSAED